MLSGQHIPTGANPWTWTLDTKGNVATIEKGNDKVVGKVMMACADEQWTATLYGMSHSVRYNCSGRVKGTKLEEGICLTIPAGPSIDVKGGTFSTAP